MMKICSKCGLEKDISEFYKRKDSIDGYHGVCKECNKKYREENKEHIKEYNKEYNKKWYEENKEHIKEQRKEYYEENKERIKEYYEENKERIKEYYEDNKEQIAEYFKKYREENPDKCREKERRYRARKNNAEGNFSEKEFKQKLIFYHYRCCHCGTDLTKTDYQRDHIQPLSKGGSNYIDNIQPLCEHCNLSKHADWIDYRDYWLQNFAI